MNPFVSFEIDANEYLSLLNWVTWRAEIFGVQPSPDTLLFRATIWPSSALLETAGLACGALGERLATCSRPLGMICVNRSYILNGSIE